MSETEGTSGLDAIEPSPGAAKPDPILTLDGMQRRFGGLLAVDVRHLEVQRNTITALIGPNGAGKTTLFNLITGFDQPDRGTWQLNGESLGGLAAHEVARRGLVRTFQLTRALPRLSVIENVMLAARDNPGESLWRALTGGWRESEAQIERRATGLLGRFGLKRMRDEYAGTLSGGQRKLLELARALMVEPEIIMLDEPMAGINPALTQTLLTHITAIRDEGRTVVFVEHDMDVVQEISDWVVVLGEGRVIAEDRPAGIAGNPIVIDAYLGTHHGEASP
ncbi:MAG: ABC transporter ATP-binding protein [Nitriliruptoraceae bacterium]